MADDARIDAPPTTRVIFEHWCQEPGCSAWGGLGYSVGKRDTRWYCFEHKWEEYPHEKGATTS
jgi:hypothetical protein